ncbi:hypothetical protein, conserved [Eimeria tenella]|uniref:Uncharacterized protein n=1 Tax=Eimeria tenella TaxID=5802 RepID=H9B8Z7_EIMTE|nr:hypothetical protein, conserved [Eimeria tenella]AET50457.1 hypothetical protein [Eimeria tenella]CDJ40045.1 hypothetical protein, conserved [Eimeria tenella]|eukprot:XP_013230798.1 hypothetical protein, conserved [Eimeria tenella]
MAYIPCILSFFLVAFATYNPQAVASPLILPLEPEVTPTLQIYAQRTVQEGPAAAEADQQQQQQQEEQQQEQLQETFVSHEAVVREENEEGACSTPTSS